MKHLKATQVTVPGRIDLTGGITDLPEFADCQPAAHLNFTVPLAISLTMRFKGFGDHGISTSTHNAKAAKPDEKTIQFLNQACALLRIEDAVEVEISSTLPSGAGLGSSGAFTVGLVGGLTSLAGRKLSRVAIAQLACEVERRVGHWAGKQDQFASVFGGLNLFEFYKDKIQRQRINSVQFCNEHLLLFHEGGERSSSSCLETILRKSDSVWVGKLNILARQIGVAVADRKSAEVANLVNHIREAQTALSEHFLSEKMKGVLEDKRLRGEGIKPVGAGGLGGCLLIWSNSERKEVVLSALVEHGFKRLPSRISLQGLELKRQA